MSEQPNERKLEAEVRAEIRARVNAGFSTREDIIEEIPDYFSNYDALDASLVKRLVEEELQRHAGEQAEWEGPTDCDRLDRVFANLERSSIVARQDFACCVNCGVSEIGDEADAETQGYAFYHMQGTERAVTDQGLYLYYGVFESEGEEDSADDVAIGQRVVEALQDVGLHPEWDGNFGSAIFLPLTWRKRRPLTA